MVGKYSIIISSPKLNYAFELDRKITILKGNSGTGKTTLVNIQVLICRRKRMNTENT